MEINTAVESAVGTLSNKLFDKKTIELSINVKSEIAIKPNSGVHLNILIDIKKEDE
jgi:hypothetical protein